MATLPPLASLRVFDAVARHQNFTKAAAELGMTQSAVSYQIKTLETFVGEPLFRRQARGIEMTARGASLAPVVRTAFASLATAFTSARDAAAGLLVISTFMTFATNWLALRIGAFQLAHTDLAVRLDVSNEVINLLAGEADVGIRSGMGSWEGLRSHFLFPSRFAAFCSPGFLERYGPFRKPADLLNVPLISPDDLWWPMWFEAGKAGTVSVAERRGIFTDRQPVIGSAAIAGHGVGLLTPAYFADDVKAARLVQLFDIVDDDGRGFYLVYPAIYASRKKIRDFRDWLLAEAASEATAGSRQR
jgi:LysR family glycine cleavage system transcriptional activator